MFFGIFIFTSMRKSEREVNRKNKKNNKKSFAFKWK